MMPLVATAFALAFAAMLIAQEVRTITFLCDAPSQDRKWLYLPLATASMILWIVIAFLLTCRVARLLMVSA